MTIPTTTERIDRVEEAKNAVVRAARAVRLRGEWAHAALDVALDNLDAALDALKAGGER